MKWPVLLFAGTALAVSSPAAAHEYADYFPYGAVELSPRGYVTARDVAAYVQRSGSDRSRILVTAHMDTAEARAFSDELSARRAQSMASELVRLGLDPSRIEMRSRGSQTLAKPTDRDVREPLNRRVTVDVNF